MKKKLALLATSAVAIFAIAGCSNSSQDIATMKGGAITIDDYFNEVKSQSTTQQALQQMIILKVFDDNYGKDVSDKDVQAEYDKMSKSYTEQGQDFKDALKQSGYTEKSYKEIIKKNLAYQKGLESHMDITEAELKTAWESFHPEVEAQIIQVATEDEAKEIKKQLDDGGDFAKIAEEKSTDTTTKEDGGKIKFDSQTTAVPSQVQTAAYKLKDGAISEPIEAVNTSTYQTSYYIVKMIKNKDKGNDMDAYKSELEEIAKTTMGTDQTFVTKVIGDELKKANVKIKDDAFKDLLSAYIETTDSSTGSSEETKASSSASKSEDSSKTEDSSSKSESSSSESTSSSSSKTEDSSK